MQIRIIPEDIDARSRAWLRLYQKWYTIHYVIGIAGIVSSVTVAARPQFVSGIPYFLEILAWMSSIAIALLAFLAPIRKAKVYANAWRLITDACGRYKHDDSVPTEKLYDAMKRGEGLIGGSDAWS